VLAAQGDSDAIAARAKGQADATRLTAQAEADALGFINAQISKNPALIEYMYIQKLASDVKLVLLPSNSPFLFDLQSLINQTKSRCRRSASRQRDTGSERNPGGAQRYGHTNQPINQGR